VRAAALLGVERTHLYRVAIGQRLNPQLLARYRALKRDHHRTVAAIRILADMTVRPPPKSNTL
jgi:hypothetical protein